MRHALAHPMPSFPISVLTFLLSTYTTITQASLVNVTVDDADPAITYTPSDLWRSGPDCTSCVTAPDADKAYMRTWHEGQFWGVGENGTKSELQTATLEFNGTALYVFCILAPASPSFGEDQNTDMVFWLDGQIVNSFVLPQITQGETTYTYNVPVYVNTLLSPGPHVVTLQNGYVGGKGSSALLDYMVYSTNSSVSDLVQDTTTASSSPFASSSLLKTSSSASSGSLSSSSTFLGSSPAGFDASPSDAPSTILSHSHTARTIALSVVFSLLLLLILAGTFIILRRRRAQRKSQPAFEQSLPPPAPQMTLSLPHPSLLTIPRPSIPTLPKPSLQMPHIAMHIPSIHMRNSSVTSTSDDSDGGAGGAGPGRIAEDPMSSGWADGTWGRISPSDGTHPSLASPGGSDAPGPLRGDALKRDASRHSRRPRRNASARTNASTRPTSPAMSAGASTLSDVPLSAIPPVPSADFASIIIPMRHPYAALPSIQSVSSIELGTGTQAGTVGNKDTTRTPELTKNPEVQITISQEPDAGAPLSFESALEQADRRNAPLPPLPSPQSRPQSQSATSSGSEAPSPVISTAVYEAFPLPPPTSIRSTTTVIPAPVSQSTVAATPLGPRPRPRPAPLADSAEARARRRGLIDPDFLSVRPQTGEISPPPPYK